MSQLQLNKTGKKVMLHMFQLDFFSKYYELFNIVKGYSDTVNNCCAYLTHSWLPPDPEIRTQAYWSAWAARTRNIGLNNRNALLRFLEAINSRSTSSRFLVRTFPGLQTAAFSLQSAWSFL